MSSAKSSSALTRYQVNVAIVCTAEQMQMTAQRETSSLSSRLHDLHSTQIVFVQQDGRPSVIVGVAQLETGCIIRAMFILSKNRNKRRKMLANDGHHSRQLCICSCSHVTHKIE